MVISKTKLILYIGIGLVIWFAIHVFLSAYIGLHDTVQPADAIVIFGTTVQQNGEPSPRLKSRLDKGLELYENKQARLIIVSGGFGKEGFDEAKVMAKYLINRAVPPENIIQDPHGINSQATAENTKLILDEYNLNSAIVVSQYHHIPRALLAMRQASIKPVYHAHSDHFELRDIYSTIREFIGYYKYLLLP